MSVLGIGRQSRASLLRGYRILACCLVAALFVHAGLMKFFALSDGAVTSDTIFGAFWFKHPSLAWMLVGFEMAVGVALLLPRGRAIAAVAAIIALTGFSGVILRELGRTEPRGCGCLAGYSSTHSGDPNAVRGELAASLVRNMAGLGLALTLVLDRNSGARVHRRIGPLGAGSFSASAEG
ncbi:MauE/DoxX family redox-associated membrane protein [Fontivita pretiosa]|uniref:MauE/DoxX family redox-associated membrane protein n=1 Tax=Fontivita pretiosa TaxID=2989684 RepID=UPI003D1635CB